MPELTWFVFDLGNVVVKLAYERVLKAICSQASIGRDELVELLEDAGGYRDMERGAISFYDFYEFLTENAQYRGSIREFQELWADFLNAIRTGTKPACDIGEIHLATNMALLGMLSLKHGRSLEWDGEKERIIGDDAANKLLRRAYRKGWEYPTT